MGTDEGGNPTSSEAVEEGDGNLIATTDYFIAQEDSPNRNRSYLLADVESVTWNSASPTGETVAVAVMRVSDEERSMFDIDFNLGVDKQVVADQVNDKLGPLGSVGAGSMSGGSVELGATALEPLGSTGTSSLGSSDDGADEGADDGADDGEETPQE